MDSINSFSDLVKKEDNKKISEKDVLSSIEIHEMPKKFRAMMPSARQAQRVGLVIFIGGFFLILIMLGAILYYFFFSKPAVTQPENNNTEVAIVDTVDNNIEEETEEEIATSTEEMDDIATSTEEIASSTEEIATSTEEVASSTDISEIISDGSATTPIIVKGNDSDKDGLTDLEEVLLGTNPQSLDSDGDTYPDYSELKNSYDPAAKNIKLFAGNAFEKFTNITFGYSVYYPKLWEINKIDEDNSIIFKAQNNHFFQIIIEPNPDNLSIDVWYMKEFSVNVINPIYIYNNTNWRGILSDDGLNLYITDKENKYIYTFSYNLGIDNKSEYFNIFKVFVKSFVFEQ